MATMRRSISLLRAVWMRRLLLYRPVLRLPRRRLRLGRLTRAGSSVRTGMLWSRGMLTSATRGVKAAVTRLSRFVRAPGAQLLSAVAGMCGGAALIGPWMVGIVLMLASAGWGVDAVLRDDSRPAGRRQLGSHEAVLERWRRAS